MKAVLLLEDGTTFSGYSVGAQTDTCGEVVFNTSMTGYQEILTDPSYYGQIVVMTYPLIGNYGVNTEDIESYQPHVRGFVAREMCALPNNWRCQATVEDYLQKHSIVGIAGVDTRALTRHLRNAGTMRGKIVCGEQAPVFDDQFERPDFICQVARSEQQHYPGKGKRVVLIDCGVKENIIRSLGQRQCEVITVHPRTSAEDILALKPDGVLVSNGPGDPEEAAYLVQTVKELVGKTVLFGICFGHQIIGLALGGKTYKLKFGHRGANHPVKNLQTGKVYITSQNHGYAVAADSLPESVKITQLNLNDNTVEGLAHQTLPVFSVQYHPEASPGPQDTKYLFDDFVALMHGEETTVCRKKAI